MNRLSLSRSLALICSVACASLLAGCSGSFSTPSLGVDAPPSLNNGTGDVRGSLYGGRQPILGAHTFLFAAPSTGYSVPTSSGTPTPIAPISLLGNTGTGCDASKNLYIDSTPTIASGMTTIPNPTYGFCYYLSGTGSETFANNNTSVGPGGFNLTGTYACTAPGQQVWLYSVGGDPGSNNNATPNINAAAALTAALGTCPAGGNFSTLSFIYMNEVSTTAFAYAVAGFASDAIHVSAPVSNYNSGLGIAFANAAQLYDIAGGADPGTHSGARYHTPNGNGQDPYILINSIADILSSCINSQYSQPGQTNNISTECNNVLNIYSAQPGAANTYVVNAASDTATAAVYFAKYPFYEATQVLAALPTTEPWHPAYNDSFPYVNPYNGTTTNAPVTKPNDLTASILYSGSGISGPSGIVSDSRGNVFASMAGNGSITGTNSLAMISPMGVVMNSAYGPMPTSIVIDGYANVWSVSATSSASLLEINNTSGMQGTNGFADVTNPVNSYLTGDFTTKAAPLAGLPMAANNVGTPYVYIVDHDKSQLDAVLASNGTLATIYNGTGGNGTTLFRGNCTNNIVGVAIDPSGDIYTANDNGLVCRKNLTGNNPASFTSNTGFSFIGGGLALDAFSNAWVTLPKNNGLVYVDTNGNFSNSMNDGGLENPTLLTVDGNGSVWVLNERANSYNASLPPSITEFSSVAQGATSVSPSGNGTYKGGYQAKKLSLPGGITIDIAGNVWVTNGSTASADPYANSITEVVGAAAPTRAPLLQEGGQPNVKSGGEEQ